MDDRFVQFLLEDSDDDIKDILEKSSFPNDIFDNEEKQDSLLKKMSINMVLQYLHPNDKKKPQQEEIQIEDDGSDSSYTLPSTKKLPLKRRRGRKKLKMDFSPPKDSEFIDSDVDDEQVQLYLKAMKKKKYPTSSKSNNRQLAVQSSQRRERQATDLYSEVSDEEFFKDLRVTRRTFDYLLSKVKESRLFNETYIGINIPVTPKMGLEIFLIYLGKKCNFKFISQKYFISESSVMINFMRVVEALIQLDESELVWPSSNEEFQDYEEKYKNICDFPGVIGSVGGCCLEMRTNKEPPAGYKIGSQRSIMYLLGVTDSLLRFTYIQAGFPGTFSLQEAFDCSSLGESLRNDQTSLFPSEELHLLGSKEFSLHKNLLTPYAPAGILTDTQKNFNEKHSLTYTVNRAFSFLICRFRVFQSQLYSSLEKIPNVIKACCIIHNIALRDEEDLHFLEPYLGYELEDYSQFREETDFVFNKPDPDGFSKRDRLAEQFFI